MKIGLVYVNTSL